LFIYNNIVHVNPWAQAVHHYAVPRSTQPSALHRMLKWVLALGLSNSNKWQWWMQVIAVYKQTWQTHGTRSLAWSSPAELSQLLCSECSHEHRPPGCCCC